LFTLVAPFSCRIQLLKPALLINLPIRAISDRMNSANSSGVVAVGSTPGQSD